MPEECLQQKKCEKSVFRILQVFFPTCSFTLSDPCVHDDSLGFEDCRFATHLLNWEKMGNLKHLSNQKSHINH